MMNTKKNYKYYSITALLAVAFSSLQGTVGLDYATASHPSQSPQMDLSWDSFSLRGIGAHVRRNFWKYGTVAIGTALLRSRWPQSPSSPPSTGGVFINPNLQASSPVGVGGPQSQAPGVPSPRSSAQLQSIPSVLGAPPVLPPFRGQPPTEYPSHRRPLPTPHLRSDIRARPRSVLQPKAVGMNDATKTGVRIVGGTAIATMTSPPPPSPLPPSVSSSSSSSSSSGSMHSGSVQSDLTARSGVNMGVVDLEMLSIPEDRVSRGNYAAAGDPPAYTSVARYPGDPVPRDGAAAGQGYAGCYGVLVRSEEEGKTIASHGHHGHGHVVAVAVKRTPVPDFTNITKADQTFFELIKLERDLALLKEGSKKEEDVKVQTQAFELLLKHYEQLLEQCDKLRAFYQRMAGDNPEAYAHRLGGLERIRGFFEEVYADQAFSELTKLERDLAPLKEDSTEKDVKVLTQAREHLVERYVGWIEHCDKLTHYYGMARHQDKVKLEQLPRIRAFLRTEYANGPWMRGQEIVHRILRGESEDTILKECCATYEDARDVYHALQWLWFAKSGGQGKVYTQVIFQIEDSTGLLDTIYNEMQRLQEIARKKPPGSQDRHTTHLTHLEEVQKNKGLWHSADVRMSERNTLSLPTGKLTSFWMRINHGTEAAPRWFLVNKPEDIGVTTWHDYRDHAIDLGPSLWRRRPWFLGGGRGENEAPGFFKERLPDAIREAVSHIPTSESIKINNIFGIKDLVSIIDKLKTKYGGAGQENPEWFTTLISEYQKIADEFGPHAHMDIRFGRELIFSTAYLAQPLPKP